jgi:recombination protein RecA
MKRLKNDESSLNWIKQMFREKNLNGKFDKVGTFVFTVESSKILAEMIRVWFPECMYYKLPTWASERNRQTGTLLPHVTKIAKEDYVKVTSIRIASERQMRQKGKYDLSIEGNHNYFSGGINNGVLVHNSPETTNGGNALRFYAHMRLEFRKTVLSDADKSAYANKTRVKIIKNKLAPPFKTAEFDIVFGQGVNTVKEVFDLAIDNNIIEKAGSWYSYKGTSLGQGEDAVMTLLQDNPEYLKNLTVKVLEKINAPEIASNEVSSTSVDEVMAQGEIIQEGSLALNDSDEPTRMPDSLSILDDE